MLTNFRLNFLCHKDFLCQLFSITFVQVCYFLKYHSYAVGSVDCPFNRKDSMKMEVLLQFRDSRVNNLQGKTLPGKICHRYAVGSRL